MQGARSTPLSRAGRERHQSQPEAAVPAHRGHPNLTVDGWSRYHSLQAHGPETVEPRLQHPRQLHVVEIDRPASAPRRSTPPRGARSVQLRSQHRRVGFRPDSSPGSVRRVGIAFAAGPARRCAVVLGGWQNNFISARTAGSRTPWSAEWITLLGGPRPVADLTGVDWRLAGGRAKASRSSTGSAPRRSSAMRSERWGPGGGTSSRSRPVERRLFGVQRVPRHGKR